MKKKGTKKYKINKKTRFKMAINTYLSIITLNVSGQNASIKIYRVADWIEKTRACDLLPGRDQLQGKRHTLIESEGIEKIFHANGNDKKAGVAIIISDKIDFKKRP